MWKCSIFDCHWYVSARAQQNGEWVLRELATTQSGMRHILTTTHSHVRACDTVFLVCTDVEFDTYFFFKQNNWKLSVLLLEQQKSFRAYLTIGRKTWRRTSSKIIDTKVGERRLASLLKFHFKRVFPFQEISYFAKKLLKERDFLKRK